ncbi:MAG: hypothetical protein PHW60_10655 [Kiritimatiellae bacterium]|nr:hypothetical protein [Kiritimatiellia bacterium]
MDRWILCATVSLFACNVSLAATQPTPPTRSRTSQPAAAPASERAVNGSLAVAPANPELAATATTTPAPQNSAKSSEYIDSDNPPYIALAAKIGTLGPGLETTIGIVEWLNLRAGGYYFRFRHGGNVKDVEFDFDVKLASVPLMVDLHPFQNEFRISGGVIYNRNMADLDGAPNVITKIGNNYYTSDEIGELIGSVRFNNWAPYIGLGYGNAVLDADKTWGFVFDIGIMWQGSPSVALSSSGTKAADPTFQQDLAIEESDIQDDADVFRIYPVLSFGISYQF